MPRLWHPHKALAKYTGDQLAFVAGAMCAVRYAHLGAIPLCRAGHRIAVGFGGLAVWFWPRGHQCAGTDLGAHRAHRDRYGHPTAARQPHLATGVGRLVRKPVCCLDPALRGGDWSHAGLWIVVECLLAFQASHREKRAWAYGDFKLLAALGAWFGWQAVPLIILLSSFVGAALGIAILIAQRQGRDTPMPFGPYLAGAGLLTLFFGDTLITEYLQLVSP